MAPISSPPIDVGDRFIQRAIGETAHARAEPAKRDGDAAANHPGKRAENDNDRECRDHHGARTLPELYLQVVDIDAGADDPAPGLKPTT